MGVKKGEENMTRKASGTEKEKVKKKDKEWKESAAARAVDWEQVEGVEGMEELPVLAGEYLLVMEEEKKLTERKDELKVRIKELHMAAGETVIGGDFFVTEIVTSHTASKLNPALLLKKGVKAEVIEECTVEGTEYHFVKVIPRG